MRETTKQINQDKSLGEKNINTSKDTREGKLNSTNQSHSHFPCTSNHNNLTEGDILDKRGSGGGKGILPGIVI